MTVQTFTALTTPESVIKAALPHKYPMDLNQSDMLVILAALGALADSDGSQLSDDAFSLRGCILETIGIEEV